MTFLRQVAATRATGVKTEYAYDPRGWVNRITQGGDTWQIGYDDEGVPVAYTAPSGNVTKLQSDKLGALVGVTNALNQSATLQRDAFGRVTRVTDALNRATQFSYNALGALTGVTEPEIGATKYDYDALGNLTKIADLNGGEWKFKYTAQGRLQTFTDPLNQVSNLAYDPLGRLAKATYPNGATYTPTYDAVGNLTRAQYSDGLDLQFKYDALDQLVETNGVKFTRDALGRITNAEQAGAGFGATYDDAGRIKTATYPGGLVVTYTYDAQTGLLTQVMDALTKTQIDFTYDKDRRPIGIARSNKVNTTLTWDKVGRLVGVKDGAIVDAQYTFDAAGQVTGAKITAPLAPTPVGQISNLSYDAASQISSNGYQSDARGQLTQSPTNKFAWDGAARLIGVDATKLEYDAFGNVSARNDGKATTRYAYNFALGLVSLVAETNATASVRYYVWTPSGKLLYAIDAADGNKVAHYHFDRTGSTLALTDANGTVTDAYAYDPYGKMLGHTGKSTQPFTFVGAWGVRQESATVYQMRARYYDAMTQRFLSRDPMGFQIANAQETNLYVYTLDNPINRIDVNGLTEIPSEILEEQLGLILGNAFMRDEFAFMNILQQVVGVDKDKAVWYAVNIGFAGVGLGPFGAPVDNFNDEDFGKSRLFPVDDLTKGRLAAGNRGHEAIKFLGKEKALRLALLALFIAPRQNVQPIQSIDWAIVMPSSPDMQTTFAPVSAENPSVRETAASKLPAPRPAFIGVLSKSPSFKRNAFQFYRAGSLPRHFVPTIMPDFFHTLGGPIVKDTTFFFTRSLSK